MSRIRTVLLAAAATAIAGSAAFAQTASTIRIEPRPYYGATVTLEQGVRVWRPLPPVSHVIVNPNNTPVNLSIADVRETVTSNNHYSGGAVAPGSEIVGGGYIGGPFIGRPVRRGFANRSHRVGGSHR